MLRLKAGTRPPAPLAYRSEPCFGDTLRNLWTCTITLPLPTKLFLLREQELTAFSVPILIRLFLVVQNHGAAENWEILPWRTNSCRLNSAYKFPRQAAGLRACQCTGKANGVTTANQFEVRWWMFLHFRAHSFLSLCFS